MTLFRDVAKTVIGSYVVSSRRKGIAFVIGGNSVKLTVNGNKDSISGIRETMSGDIRVVRLSSSPVRFVGGILSPTGLRSIGVDRGRSNRGVTVIATSGAGGHVTVNGGKVGVRETGLLTGERRSVSGVVLG